MHARPPDQVPELERRLHRWVRASLISEESAGRIWDLERGSPAATVPSRVRPARRVPRLARAPARRVPVLTEVIGYLGAALAAAAVAVFVGQTWEDLRVWQRIAVPGTGVLVFLAAGSAILRSDEPATQRLAGLLWLLAAASAGWLAATIAVDVVDAAQRWILVSVGATVAVVGGSLFAVRRFPVLQLSLVAGLAMVLAGAFFDDAVAIGIALTSLGAAWACLGALRLLAPAWATVPIGCVLATWGPSVMLADRTALGLLVGVGIGAAVVALGAALRHGLVIGIGVAGSFLYLVGAIGHFLEGRAATAIGLLVAGVALMALAVVAMRMRPRPGPPRPAHG
ncbi:MAG TPA: hypothetical protein VF029_05370 [Actinomycetota bacterium]